LNGVSTEGELRTMNMAIMVTEQDANGGLPWLPIAVAALLLALMFVLAVRKTRAAPAQP
jgi:hypothetical protein